jgi:hypothetical protein
LADIETSVAITAQTDDLQSGMQRAASSVESATEAMKAQFAGLGAAARQAQSHIGAAAGQIGSTLGALQAKAANLAGSAGSGVAQLATASRAGGGISVTEVSGNSLASLNADQKVDDAGYARQKAAIQQQSRTGDVSGSEEIAQLSDLLDQKWALDQDYYEKKLAAAANDVRARQQLTEQEELAYQKYLTDKQKLDAQAVQDSEKQWASLLQPVQRALDTSITGIILGTTTVQRALSNLARSIIAEFVDSTVKNAFGSLSKLLGGGLAGDSGGGGSTAGGSLVSGVGSLLGGIFKGGLGALVGNPFQSGAGGVLGGSLAGLFGGSGDQDFAGAAGGAAAGGGLFSGIGSMFTGLFGLLGFEHGGIVPSAAGGWSVPQLGPGGVLANLHSNEMVLPANISQGLQGAIAGGGLGGGHTFNIGISAMDAGGVSRLFMSNGSQLVSALNKALRNGSSLYQG